MRIVRVAFHTRVSLGGGKTLLVFPNGPNAPRRLVLDPPVVALLDSCQPLRSLPEHRAEFVRASRGAVPAEVVDEILAELDEAGLFTDVEDDSASDNARISTVVMPTRDRPLQAFRTARAMAEHMAAHGRSGRLLIIDGSGADVARQLRSHLDAFLPPSGLSIQHVTRDDGKAFVARLAGAAGLPHDLLTWALLGRETGCATTGAQRNLALLLTAGENVFFLDDDVVPRPYRARAPLRAEAPRLHHAHEPQRIVLYESFDEVLGALEEASADLLAEHESLLGRRIVTVVRACEPDPARAVAELDALAKQAADLFDGGRVRSTVCGIAGDSGMGSLVPWTLHYPAFDSLDRLASIVRREGPSLAEHRLLMRRAARGQMYRGPTFMSTAFGLDNTAPVQPFFPEFRDGDGVFGLLNFVCDRTFVHAMVDGVLLHSPEPGRKNQAAFPSLVRPSDVVKACIGLLAHERPIANAASAGRTLFGAAIERDSNEIVDSALRHVAAMAHQSSARSLDRLRTGHPDLAPILEAHLGELERFMSAAPGLEVYERQGGARLDGVAPLLHDFFRVLGLWRAAWTAAREINGC